MLFAIIRVARNLTEMQEKGAEEKFLKKRVSLFAPLERYR